MMATMKWTMAAQARRVLAADLRVIGVDAAYGLSYVLAGFFLSPKARSGEAIIGAPVYALSFVIFYLAIRICNSERDDKTAVFFANLPRRRMITYWMHSATLGMFVVVMEIVISIGLVLRLKTLNLGSVGPTELAYLALPWLVGAFAVWAMFGMGTWFARARLSSLINLFLTLSISLVLIVWAQRVSIPFQALVMLLITCYMLWDGARRWQKLQIGELS